MIHYFDSVYLQLASWSTMEFHLRKNYADKRYLSCIQSKSKPAIDLGGVTDQVRALTSLGECPPLPYALYLLLQVFSQMGLEWTHTDLRMFQLSGIDNWEIDLLSSSELFYANPKENVKPNILKHFYILGRFLAFSLLHKQCIGQPFGLTVFGPLRGYEKIPRHLFEWIDSTVDEAHKNGILLIIQKYEEM